MKKIFLLFCSLQMIVTIAQTAGDVAQNFGTFPGFNNSVFAVAIQNDGKILVGGSFTAYQQKTENYIIRLNPDGSKDTSFNTGIGFNSTTNAITIQSDGKILIGGFFTTYNGVTENNIIRLNNDGSKDTSFNTGTGFYSAVNAISIQNDGKILVGGVFNQYQGVSANYIVRLNTDGSKDTSFNTGTGFNGNVLSIALQNDGKILVGGSFTAFQGQTENRIIRLNANGSKDTSFITGIGFNNEVKSIKVQNDDKIIIGGNFDTYFGGSENRIIRLNTDGSKDISFNTGTGFNINVTSITIQNDNKILIGGFFTTFKGITENRIIRLNTDGSKDISFNSGSGFSDNVFSIAIQSDGKLVIGGSFPYYQVTSEANIIRLNTDGSKDTSFISGTGFNDYVTSFAEQSDGKILVGGNFSTYNGITVKKLIRFNTDGSKDTSFNTGTGFNSTSVNYIAIQNDGKILVGGVFSQYQGVSANNIIRLNTDGSKDTSFNTGTGFNSSVNSIIIQNDGKIIVGGNFNQYQGVSANYIIRLNTDGSKDTSFNPGTGFNNVVTSIAIQSDDKILIVGYFTSYKGITENRIIRLNTDGSKDISFNSSVGFDNVVLSIALQNDGKILAGGNFFSYKGLFEYRIIRLNTDGSKDTSFNTGTGFNGNVYSIALQNDGKILVGGNFNQYQGVSANYIIRLNNDGYKDTSFNTGTGLDGAVSEILGLSNGTILVGGGFGNYKGSNESACLIKLFSGVFLNSENFISDSFIIYPNPVKEILNIDLLDNNTILDIKIYDLQGKLALKDTNKVINLNHLSNGLYIVKVATKEGVFTKKFIKE